MRKAENIKANVIAAYNGKVMTVDQIASVYGVARRTVYSWVTANRSNMNKPRKALYLSKDEAEALLLTIMVSDGQTGKYKAIVESIENRLLDIADELGE